MGWRMGASTIGSVCRPPAADRRIAGERCSAIRSRRVDRRCGRARAWRDSGSGQSAERRHRTTPRVWAARGDRATERHRRSGPSRHSMARRTHALAGRPAAPAFPRRRPPCRRGRRAPARRIAIRVHPGGVCRQGGCRPRTPIATYRSHDLSCGRAKIRHLDGPRRQPGSSARTRHGCCASRRHRSLANTCARRSATRGFRRAAEGAHETPTPRRGLVLRDWRARVSSTRQRPLRCPQYSLARVPHRALARMHPVRRG